MQKYFSWKWDKNSNPFSFACTRAYHFIFLVAVWEKLIEIYDEINFYIQHKKNAKTFLILLSIINWKIMLIIVDVKYILFVESIEFCFGTGAFKNLVRDGVLRRISGNFDEFFLKLDFFENYSNFRMPRPSPKSKFTELMLKICNPPNCHKIK